MKIFFRLLNKLPKIPGWSSRLHRADFEEDDDENKRQIVFSGGHGGALVDRYVQQRWSPPPPKTEKMFASEALEYEYFRILIQNASRFQKNKGSALELRCISELKKAVEAYEEKLITN